MGFVFVNSFKDSSFFGGGWEGKNGKIWGIFFCEKRTQKKLSSQINKGDHHLYRPKKDDDFVLPSGELPEPGEEEEEEEFLGFLFFSFFL